MAKKVLHQVVNTLLKGDATSDHVLLIRDWLRQDGFDSDIFVQDSAPEMVSEVRAFDLARLKDQDAVIFHHTMGSEVLAQLADQQIPLILIYHNITPPLFFGDIDVRLAQQLELGRLQLAQIKPMTRLALGASPFSEEELKVVGFEHTGVLPIVFEKGRYDLPVDETLFQACRARGPLLLFVGRLTPNKRQEDLVKLLYFYRRIEPQARLALVGSPQTADYSLWLQKFIARNELNDAVILTGHVSQQEMVTYYKAADLFVSMSEHEGFGKPLIESMFFQLPVLAYASTAIPSTMGGAGILFTTKDYEAVAELADLAIHDQHLRQRVIDGQNERLKDFLAPTVHQMWLRYLDVLNLR